MIDQRGVIDLPAIGFGTYPMRGQQAVQSVASALRAGYRLIDTAVNYQNEDAVGRGVDESGVDRSNVIVTTKLPGRDHGFDATLRSFEASCQRLGSEVIDLYLIHWPNPSVGRFVDSWRAMVRLQRDGRARSIGTSNFTEEHIERVADATGVLPVANQVEMHPYFPQVGLRAFHREHGIMTEAWSPLGKGSALFDEPVVRSAATRLNVTPAQAVASRGWCNSGTWRGSCGGG